jgi:uncharacterized membrane protein
MLYVLVLGVALWISAHMFKRLAPGPRAAMTARIGDGSKGVFAILLVLSLVLIVVGYRGADYEPIYFPPAWSGHLNNLLVILAFYVFGIGMAKGALSQRVRHPMLTGTLIWALAHLLVRGDLASVILFGGMAAWALAAMVLINAAEPRWTPPPRKPGPRDVVAIPIVLVTYAVVGLIHRWLGANPFGGLGS